MPNPSNHLIQSPPADVPEVLSRYRRDVESELRSAVPQDDAGLHQALRYHLGWIDEHGHPSTSAEGKGLRPTLCLLTCEAVGGVPEQALPAAVAVELIHSFSLIHDDIQDRDRERHHRPTVWVLWGEPQAIYAGNTLHALACKSLLNLPRHRVAPERVLRASARLAQSSLEMMQGQFLDMEFEKRLDVTTQEYLEMTARKTGALISCAMELGALIGSENPALVPVFAKAGRHLGLLFQIRDDILGLWGDAATTGKATGSDIQRKKKTYPVVHALRHATGAAATTLQQLYRKAHLSQHDVQQVLNVLEDTGARAEAEALATRLAHQALDALRPVHLSSAHSRDFQELVSFVLLRER